VVQPKRFFISTGFRSRSPAYAAEIAYSYSVESGIYSGHYRRDFGSEDEAWEFLRELRGKSVTVQYNPGKPSDSTLAETAIATLIQTRSPLPETERQAAGPADLVPQWVRPFLWMFIAVSAVGLALSLWVHLGAVMGRRVAPEAYFWMLHVGIFVVWFPAVFVSQRLVGNVGRKDFWKVVLKGSPDWMRYLVYGFFGYAVVNFLFFMTKAPKGGSGANPPAVVWRGFSGHWMAFYSAALAILYSAAHAQANGSRCVNGHSVSGAAAYCQRCGQPVVRGR